MTIKEHSAFEAFKGQDIGSFMLKNNLDIQAIAGWEQFNEWGMGSHCGAKIRRIVRAFNVMKDIIEADQPEATAALEIAVLTQISIICNG